jgi:hypothetical protein
MPLELWISSMLLHLRENSSEIGRLFMLSWKSWCRWSKRERKRNRCGGGSYWEKKRSSSVGLSFKGCLVNVADASAECVCVLLVILHRDLRRLLLYDCFCLNTIASFVRLLSVRIAQEFLVD